MKNMGRQKKCPFQESKKELEMNSGGVMMVSIFSFLALLTLCDALMAWRGSVVVLFNSFTKQSREFIKFTIIGNMWEITYI